VLNVAAKAATHKKDSEKILIHKWCIPTNAATRKWCDPANTALSQMLCSYKWCVPRA
jgi:hypothetical protein